ncbi:zinc finger BED domain-containing protein RICESLEEPER 2-like [Salvia miltiorrhiza]|uniref:zinc finger BED domain-containing protein RICESLEEPER 2-like n=1 Tax=Salvia miltiorrhiza TaxID=226208 RepID=UPI0025AD5BA6|nr:zinc finger BED domain-containing protein RICESLEEPER 2-like [Salvia miltiorrhiza]
MIKFKECARKTGIELTSSLCLDVATRWNSTYLMLDSGIKYRKVFCMLAFDDLAYKHCPTEEEWDRGEIICEFLNPFYTITTLISGTSYPTSNLYFMEVWKIARLLEVNVRSKDEVVKSMSLAMQSRFEKYWEEYSDILSMGAVFDPRMKLKLLEYCYSKIDPISSSDKINILKMKLHVLYDEYKRKGVGVSLFKVPQSSSSSSSQVRELEFREKGGGVRRQELGRGLNLNDKELEEYKSYKGGTSDSKSLLDIYLEEAPMDEKVEIDLLMYWKDNASRFGELARMACDVLSIPITTVASESSFSIGAHVLNKYRNRLLPERVQALICTRNWLHGYSDDGEDDEEEDMDQVGAPNVINVEEECYSNI